MSLSPHPLCVHDALPSRKQNRERIASKTPVIQIVIVTLHPQMTSALCLCRFQQPQALRSFLPCYPSNAYDRLTSSFSRGYFRIVFYVIKFRSRVIEFCSRASFLLLARHQILFTHQLILARVSSNFDHARDKKPRVSSKFDHTSSKFDHMRGEKALEASNFVHVRSKKTRASSKFDHVRYKKALESSNFDHVRYSEALAPSKFVRTRLIFSRTPRDRPRR